MRARIFGLFVSAGAIVLSGLLGSAQSLAGLLASAQPLAPNAYITNQSDGTVSVIDTATNMVVGSPISVGSVPDGVAVTPDGGKVYVTNAGSVTNPSNTVSVIATATNTVTDTISVGSSPFGLAVTPDGSKVYVANSDSNNVSVIDTATNTVVGSPITVGARPQGVAVTPDGSKVYVAIAFVTAIGTESRGSVSVIDTSTNTVTVTISVGSGPIGVAVTPDGSRVYVTNGGSIKNPGNTVSVIATATNTVTDTIPVGRGFPGVPFALAVTPDGSKVYVTHGLSNTVSVIATATNTVTGTISVGTAPQGVAVTPDGSKVYVANFGDNTVGVIDTATNTVIGSPIPVGRGPTAFGVFIANSGVQPAPALVCADVSGNSFAPQTAVIVSACHAGPNQQFQWASPPEVPEEPQPAGRIIYAESGHTCLTALGGATGDGAPVVSSPCVSGALAQRWNYIGGQVINVKANACLDGGNLQNFTQLVINTCNDSRSQQWQIK